MKGRARLRKVPRDKKWWWSVPPGSELLPRKRERIGQLDFHRNAFLGITCLVCCLVEVLKIYKHQQHPNHPLDGGITYVAPLRPVSSRPDGLNGYNVRWEVCSGRKQKFSITSFPSPSVSLLIKTTPTHTLRTLPVVNMFLYLPCCSRWRGRRTDGRHSMAERQCGHHWKRPVARMRLPQITL